MGEIRHSRAELLQRCFSKQEWEYLKGQESFVARLQPGPQSLDAFEQLCAEGDRLLMEDEWAHPDRPLLSRLGQTKSAVSRSL